MLDFAGYKTQAENMNTRTHWYDDVDLDEDPIDEDDWLDLGVVM
jgi:hypothetical protein